MVRISRKRLLRLRLLLAVAGLAGGLRMFAQETIPPSPVQTPSPVQIRETLPQDAPLDAILAALEANVLDYNHSVPSFLCNEHVISEMEPAPTPGGSLRTVADAVFRVRRVPPAQASGLG